MIQRNRARGTAVFCGSLLAACAIAAPPVPASSGTASENEIGSSEVVAPVPVIATTPEDAPIAARWNQLLERGDFKQVMDTYTLVSEIEAAEGGVKTDSCKAHTDAIESALKINPVSMALWYDAYRCAKALGQSGLAEQRLQSFTKVVGFALRATPPDWGDTPIRVLHFDDIAAFVQASGEKVLNLYVNRDAGSRYMPVRVVLLDSASQHQHMLTFDFLNSAMQMQRDPRAQFPVFRDAAAKGLMEMLAVSTDSIFAQDLRVDSALAKSDMKAVIQTLQTQADQGNFSAALALSTKCLLNDEHHCGAQAVDVLLPWAEKHEPRAMLWLALAYAAGNGVKANGDDARRLIDVADKEQGDIEEALVFADLRMQQKGHESEIDPLVRDIIEAYARAGDPDAELLVAEAELGDPPVHHLDERIQAGLQHAAESGIPAAQWMFAEALFNEHRDAQGMAWLLKAAQAGHVQAQSDLAHRYGQESDMNRKAGKADSDAELAREWNVRAAQGGSIDSMEDLGILYYSLPGTASNELAAQGWFQSAAMMGDIEGALNLADLYSRNAPGLDGDAGKAAKIYQSVIDLDQDNTHALLGLAELLLSGNGVAKDQAKARLLRIEAAQTGARHAEHILGVDLLYGRSGVKDPKSGVEWLKKAIKQGDEGAEVAYADALFEGNLVKRDVPTALRLWQSSFDTGDFEGANEAAWRLCTAPQSDLFDGARGMQFADELANTPGIGAAELDTVAACHAASDDFDGAIRVEQQAIRAAKQMRPLPAKMVEALQNREQLYEQHKHYTETFQ